MVMWSLRGQAGLGSKPPAPGRMLPSLPVPTGTPFQSWTREACSYSEDHTQIPPDSLPLARRRLWLLWPGP